MANNIVPFDAALAQSLFEAEGQFVVDFDLAWQWLGYSRKDNAKVALLGCGFIEEKDFLIVQELGTLAVSRPEQKIWITVECLKLWGMMAGTEQGKRVREYFLDCEQRLRAMQSNSPLPPTKAKLLELGYELEMLRKRSKQQQLLNPDQNQTID